MGSLIGVIGGVAGQASGQAGAAATSEATALSQARIEEQKRLANQREFDRQITAQQPYLDVGEMALPDFIEAISNRGDVSGLPSTQIQSDIITDFVGDQSPDYVTDRALTNLEAVEAERNKARLADLISIGTGAQGTAAGSRVNLGTTLGSSIGAEGNIRGQSLADLAKSRQNISNIFAGGVSSIPVLQEAQRGGNTGIGNPLITSQNPLGITPGGGL